MTVATEKPTTLAQVATKVAPDDDLWLGTPTEPGEKPRTAGAVAAAGNARRQQIAPPPAYVPTPVPLLGGTRWPFILVEGGEYSGKTTEAFKLAACDWIGEVYVLAIGEDVDEYGEIAPDAMRLPHDGSWHQIMGCVDFVAKRAEAAVAAGEPPVLFIIDSATKLWELLSEWAENRAKRNERNAQRLLVDPNAEVDIHTTYWNPANKRHRRLVTQLVKMQAIVVVTARAKMVSVMDANGNPTRQKEYKVETQRDLPYATTAWIRLALNEYPTIHALRRVRGGIQPGAKGRAGEPVVIDPRSERFKGTEFSLEWLLRHVLKFEPATARPSTIVEPAAGSDAPEMPARPATPDTDGADEAPGKVDQGETAPASA